MPLAPLASASIGKFASHAKDEEAYIDAALRRIDLAAHSVPALTEALKDQDARVRLNATG